MFDAQDTQKSVRSSRVDGPPPLPPSLSDKKAPDLDKLAGSSGAGTPPTGELMQIVLEHAQLAESILTSLGHMLPSFVPVASQMIASMRLGVVKALKDTTTQPQQSLAAGAGPAQPPQQAVPSPGQGGGPQPGAAGMPPPPAAAPPGGLGAPAQ